MHKKPSGTACAEHIAEPVPAGVIRTIVVVAVNLPPTRPQLKLTAHTSGRPGTGAAPYWRKKGQHQCACIDPRAYACEQQE